MDRRLTRHFKTQKHQSNVELLVTEYLPHSDSPPEDEVLVYEFQESGYLFIEKPQPEVLDCESDSESDLTDVELETAVDNEEDSQIPHSVFTFPRKMFARLYFHLHSPRPMIPFLRYEFCLLQIHHSICCQFHQSFLTALEAARYFI
ncbi:hypothetical protein EMCRGX_G029543 [Ephydatia muelleri]